MLRSTVADARGETRHDAVAYEVSVLCLRKTASEDFPAEVSGTNGILHVTGRDVDEADYALSFQAASGAWHLLDRPVSDHTVRRTCSRTAADGQLTKDGNGRYYSDTETRTQAVPEVSGLSDSDSAQRGERLA